MRQLRRQGWFAWIGLAALAIQLAAAFGHHHDHGHDHDHDHAQEHSHAYAHAQGADAVLATREHSSHSHHHGDEVQPDKTLSHAHNQNDHDHDRNHRHDDALHCGVCSAMGPGAGGIIPAVVASVLPIDQDERAFVDPPQEALTGFKSARANRARAPPAPRHC